jgi:hypothetical protein
MLQKKMQNNPPCLKHGKVNGNHDWLSRDIFFLTLSKKQMHSSRNQTSSCRSLSFNSASTRNWKKPSATCECEIEEESVYHTIFLTAFVLLTTEQKSKNKITKKMTKNFLRS